MSQFYFNKWTYHTFYWVTLIWRKKYLTIFSITHRWTKWTWFTHYVWQKRHLHVFSFGIVVHKTFHTLIQHVLFIIIRCTYLPVLIWKETCNRTLTVQWYFRSANTRSHFLLYSWWQKTSCSTLLEFLDRILLSKLETQNRPTFSLKNNIKSQP